MMLNDLISRYLKMIGDQNNWSDVTHRRECRFCNSIDATAIITLGNLKVCDDCIRGAISDILPRKSIDEINPTDSVTILEKSKDPIQLLGELYSFSDIALMAQKESSSLHEQFIAASIKLIVNSDKHPLNELVRITIIEALIAQGPEVVSVLLKEMKKENPHNFAILLSVLIRLAPDHEETSKLLLTALKNPTLAVSRSVISTMMSYPQSWMGPHLQYLEKDPRPEIKGYLSQVYKHWLKYNIDMVPLLPVQVLEKELLREITQYYNENDLQVLFDFCVSPKLYEFLQNNIAIPRSAHRKRFALIFAKLLLDKGLLDDFIERLPEAVKNVLYQVVWYGYKNVVELENSLGCEIGTVNYQHSWLYRFTFKPEFAVFLLYSHDNFYYDGKKSGLFLHLPRLMKNIFKKVLQRPTYFELKPLSDVSTEFLFEEGPDVLHELKPMMKFLETTRIECSKTTGKPLKYWVNLFRKSFEYSEFFSHKDLNLLRTYFIMVFLIRFRRYDFLDPIPMVKQMFSDFFFRSSEEYPLLSLIEHLKGPWRREYNQGYDEMVRKNIYQLFGKLPEKEWISFQNLEMNTVIHDQNLQVLHYHTLHKLYYNQKIGFDDRRTKIEHELIWPIITEPMLKAFCFLLASFGILDIAYDHPVNETAQLKGKDYLTPYDGLQAIRLTEFGSFVLRKRQSYHVEMKHRESEVIFDPERLHVSLDCEDTVKEMILERIGRKVGPRTYKVTHETLFANCNTTEFAERNLSMLKNLSDKELPENWRDFIASIKSADELIGPHHSYTVFKVKKNRPLLRLLATDPILSTLIIKAEQAHIIIEKSNIPKMKKRLIECGYLISNW